MRRRFAQALAGALAGIAALLGSSAALAWSEETHQTTGAIAWADLASRQDPTLGELLALARAHPDYHLFAPFAARLSPEMQQRALFEWLARWPDDIRGGPEDQPEWHYELRVVSGRTWLWPFTNGNASEGFGINYVLLADRCAAPAERAKAIGWLIHIVGDVQQPLHAGHQMTGDYDLTDRAGELAFVRRTDGGEPTNLHYYWDQMLELGAAPLPKQGDWASTLSELWPRGRLAELERPAAPPELFASYLEESAVLARLVGYQGTFLTATPDPAAAPVITPGENAMALALSKRRVATGGYRIADILARAMAEARGQTGPCPSAG